MKFFFTFGQNSSLSDNYVVIEAPTSLDARKAMFEHYGYTWGFQYTWESFHYQPAKYDLTEVPLGTPQETNPAYA